MGTRTLLDRLDAALVSCAVKLWSELLDAFALAGQCAGGVRCFPPDPFAADERPIELDQDLLRTGELATPLDLPAGVTEHAMADPGCAKDVAAANNTQILSADAVARVLPNTHDEHQKALSTSSFLPWSATQMTTLLSASQPTTSDAQQSGETEPERTLVQVLASIAELAPLVAQRGLQIERERRLPADLVDALRSARIYGMLVPQRYGGLAFDVPDALQVVSALARLDGSVGWNAMIGNVGSLIPFLATRELCNEVFGDGRDHIIAGSGQPTGTAERVPGGWRVTGTWPFASGCRNAEWIAGACVMMDGGSPLPALNGPGPMTRLCLMPAEDWQIHDTWHTFGLRGTGSHHVELRDAIVPDRNFFDFPFGASFAPDPLFGMIPELVMFSHGAFAVGVAEGAIADLVELAGSGVKQLHMAAPLQETERFREGVGRLGAELMAARALLDVQVNRRWRHVQRGAVRDMARVAEAQQAAVWIASACVRVAEGCFELAGARAVYESSPLQRRMRDLRVAAQHAFVHQRNYVAAGDAVLSRAQ